MASVSKGNTNFATKKEEKSEGKVFLENNAGMEVGRDKVEKDGKGYLSHIERTAAEPRDDVCFYLSIYLSIYYYHFQISPIFLFSSPSNTSI